jgi:hypothetical protein
MGLPVGILMSVTEVKNILNITSTTYDDFISNNLYPMAVYVNDWTHNGLEYEYEPTLTHYTSLSASSASGSTAAIVQPWLIRGSVEVYSSTLSFRYEEDHDYEINYETGSLVYLADSTNGTSTGGTAIIEWSCINPQGGARIAIAQLLRNSWEAKPNVVSESIGPLSRTYAAGTDGQMPGPIKAMLMPYRLPLFV